MKCRTASPASSMLTFEPLSTPRLNRETAWMSTSKEPLLETRIEEGCEHDMPLHPARQTSPAQSVMAKLNILSV